MLINKNKTPNKNTKSTQSRPRNFTRPAESPMVNDTRQWGDFVETMTGKIIKRFRGHQSLYEAISWFLHRVGEHYIPPQTRELDPISRAPDEIRRRLVRLHREEPNVAIQGRPLASWTADSANSTASNRYVESLAQGAPTQDIDIAALTVIYPIHVVIIMARGPFFKKLLR